MLTIITNRGAGWVLGSYQADAQLLLTKELAQDYIKKNHITPYSTNREMLFDFDTKIFNYTLELISLSGKKINKKLIRRLIYREFQCSEEEINFALAAAILFERKRKLLID